MKRKKSSKFDGMPKKARSEKPVQKGNNPFETIKSRSKFDVMGRDQKGQVRHSVKARSKAIAARQASLLEEFRQTDKHNKFTDQRIGEKEAKGAVPLSEEDKTLQRFKEERARRLERGARYKLADGDEEEDILTHEGRALSKHLSESNALSTTFSDDEENGNLDADTVSFDHFGGGAVELRKRKLQGAAGEDESEERKEREKTKKEVMAEIMLKSKMHKFEKTEGLKKQTELLESLNADVKDLFGVLDFRGEDVAASKDDPKALLKAIRQEVKKEAQEEDLKDEYVLETRRLAMESRAAASDRLKSPEEAAKEERTKLERLESARVRRMNGEADLDEHEALATAGPTGGYAARRNREKLAALEATKKKKKKAAAFLATDDDLDGNVDVEDKYGAGESSDSGSDFDEDINGDEEENLLDEEVPLEEAEEEAEEEVISTQAAQAATPAPWVPHTSAGTELPFVFSAPADHKAFVSLLEDWPTKDHPTIVYRIRACNHLSLAAENRPKLERFYRILVTHFHIVANTVAVASADARARMQAALNWLTVAIWEMSQDLPKFAPRYHRQLLASCRTRMHDATANLVDSQDMSSNSCMPDAGVLLYLKLLALIFPVSDFRHNVLTPAILFVGDCLSRAPLLGPRDVAAGLFLAEFVLDFIKDSKRVVPELIIFLQGLIEHCFGLSTDVSSRINMGSGAVLWDSLLKGKKTKAEVPGLSLTAILFKNNDAAVFKTVGFRRSSLAACLKLARDTCTLYHRGGVVSAPEMFVGIRAALSQVKAAVKATSPVSEEVMATSQAIDEMSEKASSCRQPLVLRLAPAMIKSFAPQFEENYRPGKDYDHSSERAEIKKLSKKLKREKSGALKELRRDTKFLAAQKFKDQEKTDKKRSDNYKRVIQDLEEQQGDSNIWAKESRKKKKNAKK